MADPRRSRQWKRVRASVLKGATHCEICDAPLDFSAPARSRWAPSVDHIAPLHDGADPFDVTNLRPVHCGCNSTRGNLTRRGVYRPQEPKLPTLRRATWW